jgi:hypothetical protein
MDFRPENGVFSGGHPLRQDNLSNILVKTKIFDYSPKLLT